MATQLRKEREKENRRQAILDAAEKLMSINGVHGLNIDMVAQETELAKGTIYLYFKSKEEILASLTLKARHSLFQAFSDAVKQHKNPIDQLKSVIYGNYKFYQESPLLYDLVSLYEANNQLVETQELQAVSNNITNLVVEIVREAQKQSLFSADIDPVRFTICMWGMTIGIHQVLKIRGKSFQENLNISEEDLLFSYIQILENGIKK